MEISGDDGIPFIEYAGGVRNAGDRKGHRLLRPTAGDCVEAGNYPQFLRWMKRGRDPGETKRAQEGR